MTTSEPSNQETTAGASRLVAIDALRGFAILWVVLYHLWTDIKYPHIRQIPDQFRVLPDRLGDGRLLDAFTALSDAFFRVGFLGVPLFMMLSGLSLTLTASRRELTPRSVTAFLGRRLRRVLLPYWFGFAFALAFAAGIAFVQWQRHGGFGFMHFYHVEVQLDRGSLLAGAFGVPRLFEDRFQFAPEGSLWFVVLIVQYYVLFPPLLWMMRRIGALMFVAAALALTVVALALVVRDQGDLATAPRWIEMLAPFRAFEFALGMAIAGTMGRGRAEMRILTAPAASALAVGGGVSLFVAGNMIEGGSGYREIAQGPLIIAGLSIAALPLLLKAAGAFETLPPIRALAWVGVISYAVLIVNEPLRGITHAMRIDNARDGWMVLWVGFTYIPVTLLLARPLAVFLGLVDRQRRSAILAASAGATAVPAFRS